MSRVSLHTARALRKARDEDEAAFRALRARRWYELGAGAWVGLALVAGVGIALVIFFYQHRQERARCTLPRPAVLCACAHGGVQCTR